jgi:hypothetical protein
MVRRMSDPAAPPEECIAIVVDTDSCTSLTLELAVELAVSLKAQLQGLFIENTDLLSTSKLPFSCEITLGTGRQRTFTPDIVESSYRRLAYQFQHLFEQKARQSVVRYSFQAMRGRRQDLMTQPQQAGYLIIERKIYQPRWKQSRPLPRKRILVADGDDQSRIKTTLQFLAHKFPRHKIDVFWLGDSEHRQQIASRLSGVHIEDLDPVGMETVLHGDLDYIVVSRQADSELISRLITEASCPVILVS